MSKISKPIAGLHLVRYGTAADQKYLLNEFTATYDQLVINANMVAHMPTALASFVTQRTHHKPYFIDPQTHAFQHSFEHLTSPNNKEKIKTSIKKLLDAYGEPVKTCVTENRSTVLPKDFKDNNIRKEFCKKVIDFQLNSLKREVKEPDSAKYYNFLRKKENIELANFGPNLVVAPYFYLSSNTLDQWGKVNIECAVDAKEIAEKRKIPLGIQIVISKDVLLSDNYRKRLCQYYKNIDIKPDVFLLWVDVFSEQESTKEEIIAFIELVNSLGEIAPVVNLYGSFFSIVLARCKVANNLIGVTHSLEYGETRGVVPVGGGIPISKYYLPLLHYRLKFRDAFRAIRTLGGIKDVESFHRKVCNCRECRKVIKNDPEINFEEYGTTITKRFIRNERPAIYEYPTPEAKDHCVKHYMWCKHREYTADFSLPDVINELKQAKRQLERVLGLEQLAYCDIWQTVLDNYSKRCAT